MKVTTGPVNVRVCIRPAVKEDLEAISRLRTEAILETVQDYYSREQLQQWAAIRPTSRTLNRINDTCLRVGVSGNRIVACNSLDLEQEEMLGLFVSPSFQHQGLGGRMVADIERLAIRFGFAKLRVEAALPAIEFYRACNYRPRPGAATRKDPRTDMDSLPMTRTFPHRQTRFGARIRRLLENIGIPRDYGRRRRLMLQAESRELATIGCDVLGREQMLHPGTAMAWYDLRNAAESEGVGLQVISAYRSVGYQVSIIERKRSAGQSLEEILKVCAAPGYSEHHSGHAIDISCPESEPLAQCFENTPAFEWLTASAHRFGFSMSYPRNNRHGLAYEPWHWIYRDHGADKH